MRHRNRIIAVLVCTLSLAVLVWYNLHGAPTPVSAAERFGDRLIAGDIEWIYTHMTETERSLVSSQILKDFHESHIRPYLAEVRSVEHDVVYETASTAVLHVKLSRDGGGIDEFLISAAVVDGKVIVGAVESLRDVAANLQHSDLPAGVARVKRAAPELSQWFIDRGVNQMYSIQDGRVHSLKGLADR